MKRALILGLVAAALAAVPAAHADGDPASDYLITQQVFYPYYSRVPKSAVGQLEATVADANKQHFTIRVAVITSPYDLGSVSSLWERPQDYARFLAAELAFAYGGRLLIVSPAGYGYVAKTVIVDKTPVVTTASSTRALLSVVPIGKGTGGLLSTADRAVRLLASRSGVRLAASSGRAGTGSSSSRATIVIAIAACAGALLLAAVAFLRRGRRQRPRMSTRQTTT